jgi:SAM-dependent methyltransferase
MKPLNNPKSNRDGNRQIENGRLVYYHQIANQGYWETIWEKVLTSEYYKPFQAGKLYEFDKPFKRHLPKDGLILEAGCGTAQWVIALETLGYDCIGLDYAVDALRKARQMMGPLSLISGDLTSLGLVDDSFDAIISIGVVEHRREGPKVFLDEMHRVLKPGGVMLISVPYFNPLRLWRAARGAYQDEVNNLDFYQYAFTRQEFCAILEDAGYEIETTHSYAHQHSLSQELHWLKTIHPFLRRVLLKLSDFIPYVNSELGHMLMVVARKNNHGLDQKV